MGAGGKSGFCVTRGRLCPRRTDGRDVGRLQRGRGGGRGGGSGRRQQRWRRREHRGRERRGSEDGQRGASWRGRAPGGRRRREERPPGAAWPPKRTPPGVRRAGREWQHTVAPTDGDGAASTSHRGIDKCARGAEGAGSASTGAAAGARKPTLARPERNATHERIAGGGNGDGHGPGVFGRGGFPSDDDAPTAAESASSGLLLRRGGPGALAAHALVEAGQ